MLEDAGQSDDVRQLTHAIERERTTEDLSSAPKIVRHIVAAAGWTDSGRLESAALYHPHDASLTTSRETWIVGVVRAIAFDATTGYGSDPIRALTLLLALGVLLTPVYMFPILRPSTRGGIFKVLPVDSIPDNLPVDAPETESGTRVVRVQTTNFWNAFRLAAYFSALSALNIGFEQFNPGDWLRRLQSREYLLQATGWVRILAGFQALSGLLLLAMWAITQFGKPFE